VGKRNDRDRDIHTPPTPAGEEYCENCHDKHKWNNGTTENFSAHRIHTTARVRHTGGTGSDTPETLNVRGHATHRNIGTSMRGTAILARN